LAVAKFDFAKFSSVLLVQFSSVLLVLVFLLVVLLVLGHFLQVLVFRGQGADGQMESCSPILKQSPMSGCGHQDPHCFQ